MPLHAPPLLITQSCKCRPDVKVHLSSYSTFLFRMWRRGIPQPVEEESKVVAEAVEAAEHPEQLGHEAAPVTVPWQGIDEDVAVPNPQLVDAAEGSSQPGSVLYG